MHIPDGFLDAKTWGTAWGASAGFTGYALYAAKKKLSEKTIPLIGITAAFIFAAQMLNFPVAGGTSGHFLGAILAMTLAGAWPGFLIMVVVLAVQCLFFADGGLTALGANIFNMAVVGGILCYFLMSVAKKALAKRLGERGAVLVAVPVFSWFSVFLASIACSVELAISGTIPLNVVLPAMVGVHSIIGIGEALIATIVVSVVIQTRPDLVDFYEGPRKIMESSVGEVTS